MTGSFFSAQARPQTLKSSPITPAVYGTCTHKQVKLGTAALLQGGVKPESCFTLRKRKNAHDLRSITIKKTTVMIKKAFSSSSHSVYTCCNLKSSVCRLYLKRHSATKIVVKYISVITG